MDLLPQSWLPFCHRYFLPSLRPSYRMACECWWLFNTLNSRFPLQTLMSFKRWLKAHKNSYFDCYFYSQKHLADNKKIRIHRQLCPSPIFGALLPFSRVRPYYIHSPGLTRLALIERLHLCLCRYRLVRPHINWIKSCWAMSPPKTPPGEPSLHEVAGVSGADPVGGRNSQIWGFKISLPLYANKPLRLSVDSWLQLLKVPGSGPWLPQVKKRFSFPYDDCYSHPGDRKTTAAVMKLSNSACALLSELSSSQRWRAPHAMVWTVTLKGHSRRPHHFLCVSCQRLKACYFPKYPSRTFTSWLAWMNGFPVWKTWSPVLPPAA